MKIFLLSSFGILVAMSAAAPTISTSLDPQFAKLHQFAKEYAGMLDGFVAKAGVAEYWNVADSGEGSAGDGKTVAWKERETGLRPTSVQGASGVQSGASGLTPEDEWRRRFPHRPGYSR